MFPVVKYLLIPHEFFALPHIKRKVIFKNYFLFDYQLLPTSSPAPFFTEGDRRKKRCFYFLKKNCSGKEDELLRQIRFRLRAYFLDFVQPLS